LKVDISLAFGIISHVYHTCVFRIKNDPESVQYLSLVLAVFWPYLNSSAFRYGVFRSTPNDVSHIFFQFLIIINQMSHTSLITSLLAIDSPDEASNCYILSLW